MAQYFVVEVSPNWLEVRMIVAMLVISGKTIPISLFHLYSSFSSSLSIFQTRFSFHSSDNAAPTNDSEAIYRPYSKELFISFYTIINVYNGLFLLEAPVIRGPFSFSRIWEFLEFSNTKVVLRRGCWFDWHSSDDAIYRALTQLKRLDSFV